MCSVGMEEGEGVVYLNSDYVKTTPDCVQIPLQVCNVCGFCLWRLFGWQHELSCTRARKIATEYLLQVLKFSTLLDLALACTPLFVKLKLQKMTSFHVLCITSESTE